MKRILRNNTAIPRWIIFLADLILAIWAFVLAYFIAEQFEFPSILRGHFALYTGFYALVCIHVFFLFKLSVGLIRYSSMFDVLRIFYTMLTVTLIYALLESWVIKEIFQIDSISKWGVLLVNFFIGSSLLIFFRIAAKSVFHYFNANTLKGKKIRVLIYGADNNAILVKQALERSEESTFVVVGFVETDRSKLNNVLEQKKVYHLRDLRALKEKKGVDQLVLLKDDHLDSTVKQMVVNRCLFHGIKVLTVPTPDKWLSGQMVHKEIKSLKIEELLQREPIKINNPQVKADIYAKRVLVTGAAGSIGSELVRQILQYQPAVLIVCDQAESPLHEVQLEIEEAYPNMNCKFLLGDVRKQERMEDLFKQYAPQMVYHAAAYKHVPLMENNPYEAIHTNISGTRIMADLSVRYGVEKFVMISTDKAVNPANVMGGSKRIAEIYTQSLNEAPFNIRTRFITTRFGNVLGSNGSVIPLFRKQIEKGGPVTVTHPDITRYFMTIPEAVQLVLEAGVMGQGGEIYVFDMGQPVSIADLAEKMIRLAGLEPGKDINIVYTGLRPGEKLYEELLNDTEYTLPTHHEKINIARVRKGNYIDVCLAIDKLMHLTTACDGSDIVRQMKKIVPEFISNNSPYQHLDY